MTLCCLLSPREIPEARQMTEKYTVADEAVELLRDVTNKLFMPEPVYDHKRVPQLVKEITDAVIAKLQQSRLPRKYICHCTIVQRNGAGLHSTASCAWNPESDGCVVHKAENKAMICIVTVFGVTM